MQDWKSVEEQSVVMKTIEKKIKRKVTLGLSREFRGITWIKKDYEIIISPWHYTLLGVYASGAQNGNKKQEKINYETKVRENSW